MDVIASFSTKPFNEELHTDHGAILSFRTLGRVFPKKIREVLVRFQVPILVVIFNPLLLLDRVFVSIFLIPFLPWFLWWGFGRVHRVNNELIS